MEWETQKSLVPQKDTHTTKKNVNLLACLLVYIYLCGVKK